MLATEELREAAMEINAEMAPTINKIVKWREEAMRDIKDNYNTEVSKLRYRAYDALLKAIIKTMQEVEV